MKQHTDAPSSKISPRQPSRCWGFRSALALTAIATTLAAAPASADTLLVVLDVSGSMSTTRPNHDGHGSTRFDAAKYIAATRVNAVKEGRVYGLWTFSGTTYRQVVAPADYRDDPTGSQTAVLNALARLPQPGSDTPLAKAMCEAVDMLRAGGFIKPLRPGSPDERPIIELVTDGEENSTPKNHECFGPTATNPADPEPGTWQQKIMSKAQTGSPALTPKVPPESAFVIVNANYLLAETDPIVSQKAMSEFTGLVAQKSSGVASTIPSSGQLPQLGDVTGDGCVDMDDYDALVADLDLPVQRYTAGDLNGDAMVDTDDYLTLLQNFGNGCQ